MGGYERCLIILASGKHDDICGRRLGSQRPRVGIVAVGGLLDEAHDIASDAAKIAMAVSRDNTEQTLSCFFRKIGLLEHALGGVDVRQIERRPRVTRVENGRQAHAALQGLDHDPVHLVVCDVANVAEVYRVDDLVVAIILIAIEVLCLTTVACTFLSVVFLVVIPRKAHHQVRSTRERGIRRPGERVWLTGVMKEERVVRPGFLDQPMHRSQDVLLGRLAHWILLVVCEDDHVLALVAKVLN